VHQLVCFDAGGSSGQHGRSSGQQQSGAAMGARKQSQGRHRAPGSRVRGSSGDGNGGALVTATAADFGSLTA
jgi:hypothetical protein